MSRPRLKKVEKEERIVSEPLQLKYRPFEFDQVIGQDPVVASLRANLKRKDHPRAFLFVGPSGVGKTTLARIVAKELGIESMRLVEVDAATYSKIEDVRRLTETLMYATLGEQRRMMILDEVHRFSPQAWAGLLKPIEEGGEDCYWCLCTTDVHKVPNNIITRCQRYELKPVRSNDIYELLDTVAELEELEVSEDVLQVLARKCEGSPRMALQMLSMAHACRTREEALELVTRAIGSTPSLELIKLINSGKGFTWERAIKLIRNLDEDETAESFRLNCLNYTAKVLLGTNGEDKAARLLRVLEVFSQPFHTQEKLAPLLLAVGKLLLEDEGGD
jgi:DNA polymerase III gamma/tau subunit